MKKFFFLVLALSILSSCEETVVLKSTLNTFNETDLEACQNTPCPKITIDFPVYSGEKTITDKINDKIESYLSRSLHIGEGAIPATKKWKEVAMQFVNANKDLKTEFDMELNYEATVSIAESFRNEQILSLERRSYLFTGGAHGYGSIHFNHFDLKTGEELMTKDILVDLPNFMHVAEKEFRKAHGLAEEGSINATGFWFEDDRFSLPETIGLTEDGIVLIYNQYDIASYAEGAIEVALNWKTISPYLSKIYFP